jgi:hypothetical protein
MENLPAASQKRNHLCYRNRVLWLYCGVTRTAKLSSDFGMPCDLFDENTGEKRWLSMPGCFGRQISGKECMVGFFLFWQKA